MRILNRRHALELLSKLWRGGSGMTKNDKIYEAFKTVMECSLFLAMAFVPWFLLGFVVWAAVAW